MCSNFETKKFLEKLNVQNIFLKEILNLLVKLMKKKLKVLMKNFFQQTNFGLLLAHTKKKKFLFKTHLILKKI